MIKMKKWRSAKPEECQLCKDKFISGSFFYDANVKLSHWEYAHWAIVCTACFRETQCSLGIGKGQMYHWTTGLRLDTGGKPWSSGILAVIAAIELQSSCVQGSIELCFKYGVPPIPAMEPTHTAIERATIMLAQEMLRVGSNTGFKSGSTVISEAIVDKLIAVFLAAFEVELRKMVKVKEDA